MNEATIGLIVSNVVTIVGAYFAFRLKLTALSTGHDESMAKSDAAHGSAMARSDADHAASRATLDATIFGAANDLVVQLGAEINRLRDEVTRLHRENAQLSQRLAVLERNESPPHTPEP